MKKVLGYIIGIAGLALIAASYSFIRESFGITLPEGVTEFYVMIVGIVLALVGAFLAFKGKGKKKGEKSEEVPIYHGNRVVGYRRH